MTENPTRVQQSIKFSECFQKELLNNGKNIIMHKFAASVKIEEFFALYIPSDACQESLFNMKLLFEETGQEHWQSICICSLKALESSDGCKSLLRKRFVDLFFFKFELFN